MDSQKELKFAAWEVVQAWRDIETMPMKNKEKVDYQERLRSRVNSLAAAIRKVDDGPANRAKADRGM